MKTVEFKIALTFDENIRPNQLKEIAENIARSIVSEANNGQGIAPKNTEAYTEKVEVGHLLCQTVVKNICE